MTNKFGRIIAVLLVFTVSTFAVDYNKVMNDRLKKSLGNDFKDYQSISFPTTNFGLITSYTPTGNTSKPKDSDFFCDTWECLGLGSNVPTDLEMLKSINGFAAVGDSDAVITLSDTEKSDLGFKALLPKIAGILNFGGSFDQKKTVVSELQLGPFYIRKLRRDRMAQYINGLPSNNAMKQAYLQGRLLLIVADVVSTNMSVKVKVDADTAAKIDAKIGAIPTGSVSSSFSDASFGFNIERGQTGEYTFKVTRPVVVLRLAKRQPAAGVLGAENDNDWKDWIVTKIPKK